MSTFAIPNERGVPEMVYEFLKKTVAEKNFKFFSKKFGSLKIKRTFASPFEKRVLERGLTSSLKRLFYCTRSKYREKQFIEKR